MGRGVASTAGGGFSCCFLTAPSPLPATRRASADRPALPGAHDIVLGETVFLPLPGRVAWVFPPQAPTAGVRGQGGPQPGGGTI